MHEGSGGFFNARFSRNVTFTGWFFHGNSSWRLTPALFSAAAAAAAAAAASTACLPQSCPVRRDLTRPLPAGFLWQQVVM